MKKLGIILGWMLALVLAFVVGTEVFGDPTGLGLTAPILAFTPLIGVKRKYQKPELGGSKRLWIIFCDDLENEVVTYDMLVTGGELAGPTAIPLATGKKAIEVQAWYDTTKFDFEMKPGAGFTQGFEFKILGINKDNVKFLTRLYEVPVNIVIQGNDDSRYYLGQKHVPFMLEAVGASPEKGNARKDITVRAKNDGLTTMPVPMADDVVFLVEALPTV
ncbi:hypothetical protein [Runella zeae]|uniref:hypothetical protein n=1 Tax=Runella zeae TaxID=94255 RepID=UPI0004172209|nr:hypothetical protein [Runella zeae]